MMSRLFTTLASCSGADFEFLFEREFTYQKLRMELFIIDDSRGFLVNLFSPLAGV